MVVTSHIERHALLADPAKVQLRNQDAGFVIDGFYQV